MLRFAGSRKVIEINSDVLKPFTMQIAELVAAKSGKVVEVVEPVTDWTVTEVSHSIDMSNAFTVQRLNGETDTLALDNQQTIR